MDSPQRRRRPRRRRCRRHSRRCRWQSRRRRAPPRAVARPSTRIAASESRVKLTDFGIAKLLDAQGVTSTGQVLGSPAHMAPEQIEGGDVDGRADVFGMGVLLYECMVGHLPFEGNNPAQVLRRVLDGIYPSRGARAALGRQDLQPDPRSRARPPGRGSLRQRRADARGALVGARSASASRRRAPSSSRISTTPKAGPPSTRSASSGSSARSAATRESAATRSPRPPTTTARSRTRRTIRSSSASSRACIAQRRACASCVALAPLALGAHRARHRRVLRRACAQGHADRRPRSTRSVRPVGSAMVITGPSERSAFGEARCSRRRPRPSVRRSSSAPSSRPSSRPSTAGIAKKRSVTFASLQPPVRRGHERRRRARPEPGPGVSFMLPDEKPHALSFTCQDRDGNELCVPKTITVPAGDTEQTARRAAHHPARRSSSSTAIPASRTASKRCRTSRSRRASRPRSRCAPARPPRPSPSTIARIPRSARNCPFARVSSTSCRSRIRDAVDSRHAGSAPPRPSRLAAAFAVVVLGGRTASAQGRVDVEKARAAYLARNYAEAEERLRALVDPKTGLKELSLLSQARMYLGAVLLAQGKRDPAVEVFEKMILEDPAFEPDPLSFPGDVINTFFDVRAQLQEKIRQAAADLCSSRGRASREGRGGASQAGGVAREGQADGHRGEDHGPEQPARGLLAVRRRSVPERRARARLDVPRHAKPRSSSAPASPCRCTRTIEAAPRTSRAPTTSGPRSSIKIAPTTSAP